ncbi:restriction endonuclease [Stieleria maiorica]|nr:restriction endonuclease [Stieleria maiorica]
MAVPDFQSMFVPFLSVLSDGEEHAIKQVTEAIADEMDLTRQDREEMLSSGSQRRLANRVGWARTHLKHAKLIEYTGRGVMKITQRGLDSLSSHPNGLTLKDLDQFAEHYEWHHKKRPSSPASTDGDQRGSTSTPEEQIASLTTELNAKLADDILAQVREMDPYKFEQLVIDLLFAMGYGGSRAEAAKVTKASNDEGIDGIISEDRLGLDMIYVQAKRWKDSVGRKEIQAFVGALAGKQASKGVFITTSSFRNTAIEYAEAVTQKVVLIDGERLGELMIEYDIGVSRDQAFVLKKIDSDYFEDM